MKGLLQDEDEIRVLTKNAVKCLVCNTVLESKYRHNFVTCGCSNETACDGGLEYQRILAKDLDKVENLCKYVTMTKQEYQDMLEERKRLEEEKLQQRIENGEMECIGGRWMSKEVAKIVLSVLENKEK